jgi:hypothetical protein
MERESDVQRGNGEKEDGRKKKMGEMFISRSCYKKEEEK